MQAIARGVRGDDFRPPAVPPGRGDNRGVEKQGVEKKGDHWGVENRRDSRGVEKRSG